MTVSRQIGTAKTGAIRLVSLRLTSDQEQLMDGSKMFSRFVEQFLETEVQRPYRFKQLSGTSFMINGPGSPSDFEDYVLTLHDSLKAFLFGSEDKEATNDFLTFAGTEEEVATFATEPEEKARKRSESFMSSVRMRQIENDRVANDDPEEEKPLTMSGTRYRGFFHCQKKALLGFRITPAHDDVNQTIGFQDVDRNISQTIRAAGDNAIDFCIDVLEKSSADLQSDAARSSAIVFNCPFPYGSLSSSADKSRFLACLSRQPEWVRNRIILTVEGTPPSTNSSMLIRYKTEFSPLIRNLGWMLGGNDLAPAEFIGSQLHAVGLDLDQVTTSRETALRSFCKHVPALKELRIAQAVRGLRSLEELNICIDHGIVYASGDAITSALRQFVPAQLVKPERLPLNDQHLFNNASSPA